MAGDNLTISYSLKRAVCIYEVAILCFQIDIKYGNEHTESHSTPGTTLTGKLSRRVYRIGDCPSPPSTSSNAIS